MNYVNSSILRRAQKKNLIKINFYNPRDYAGDKSRSLRDRGSSTRWSGHKKVDDRPFGGGPGMVLKTEPIIRIIDSVFKRKTKSEKQKVKMILLSPAGKQFTQVMARDWAKKYKDIILLSGRYEGVDERVKKILLARRRGGKAEEVSIGPYILTGGELPAAIIIDAVSRHIPNVLGKAESLEESRGVGFPVYTKPEVFKYNGKKYKVPIILLSGHHQKIQEWKKKHSKKFF